jgi:hypothetical protein
VSPDDDLIDRELMLNRFRRLLTEVQRGHISRNAFEVWEVEILLDLDACEIEARHRADILRQYQRAVEREMESGGADIPMKLSQFLVLRSRK